MGACAARLHQQIGGEDDQDADGGDVAHEEIDGIEEAGVDGAAVGELVPDLVLGHLPAHEGGEQEAADRKQPVGAQMVQEVEEGVAEDLDIGQGAEGKAAEDAD